MDKKDNICVKCNTPIVAPMNILRYENKNYHPPCLTCDTCKKSLSGVQFVKGKNGDLVCNDCYAKVAPKCIKCAISFKPGESYKTVGDEFYHGACFTCSGPCKKPIDGEFYDFENKKFVCTECYEKYGADAIKN